MKSALLVLVVACAGLYTGACGSATSPRTPHDGPRTATRDGWVESTLKSLSIEQKAAQMVFVRAEPGVVNPRAESYRDLLAQVRDLEVGGVVLFRTPRDTVPLLLNDLQDASPLPLLVAADVERSVAFRVPDGSVDLPWAMAIGATRSPEAARFAGELTARESRALGIHWALGPVADVNNNPENPVINIRAFGEDPTLVSEMARAWIQGARAGGVITTAKHFPGHGDTETDSHLALATIPGDRARLDRIELAPFRAAVSGGVDAVMLGHLLAPAIDASGTPATLSPEIDRLLREELGFSGLVVTDALDMKGFDARWIGGAVVDAVRAGADVLMLPADPKVAVQSIARAVAEGTLEEARLDLSVRRLLSWKHRLGLDASRRIDAVAARAAVGSPEDEARAAEIARQAITVVRNRDGVLPLATEAPLRALHVVLSTDFAGPTLGSIPAEELAARAVDTDTRRLGPQLSDAAADEIVAAARDATHVLVSAYVAVISGKGSVAMDPSHARLLERLAAGPAPVIVMSFGNPYVLGQFPKVGVYLCAYGANESSQRAAIGALFGEFAIAGKLPVSIPGQARFGDGLEIPRREQVLASDAPEELGFRSGALDEVGRLLDGYVERHAFPGGVVAVGHQGKLAYLRAFGTQTYDAASPAVTLETIYDIASLTKVVATTTMAMILVDEGRLDLDTPVSSFLPHFRGGGKELVTVRHLLTHSSGIEWWSPLFKEIEGSPAYVERIQAMPLVNPPGTVEKYSDLGLILLGEILERVAGEPLEDFVARRIFEPLAMATTTYRPLVAHPDWTSRIAPTENDPWRGRVLRGEVHDENAFALGGVAPHAGLFSTAGDLARFAQMLLWRGVYDHRRLVSPDTVESFTRRAGVVPGSSRALGWDTKSPAGSSAGTLFSADSFGHTGFTGTSMWMDPDRQLFVILLTNRVHPTRDNNLIREVRPAVADAVVRSLIDPAATPGRAHAGVRTGLDRIADGDTKSLAGKRLGLIAHAASVTRGGEHAIDVFRRSRLQLVRVFAPEHGLRGEAAAGEAVANAVDPSTGLQVVSLYGEHRRPTRQDLAGLDALVFDLQDAGVRFYTYSSTLLLALEAAADAGIELIVLDRPNPLGGVRAAGPQSAPRDVVPASFVNLAPGPLVHGVTAGEMARYSNSRLARPARLTVIAMNGWRRDMTWRDTGRAWVPPSPNLRTPEAALVYPGVALLEGTNVSEGRGTDAPFLLFGAPWLDPEALRLEVPGYRFGPVRFTPRSSPAAPRPKHEGVECRGLRIEIDDPRTADPVRLGVTLLSELSRQGGFQWARDGEALTWLIGTPRFANALRAGESVDAILEGDAAAIAEWRSARRLFLLYPEAD
ncbi:MAG TPA: glycoside hydrolase family 3 N-terminal domain-containing protein [Kofleriaceae bacterium]